MIQKSWWKFLGDWIPYAHQNLGSIGGRDPPLAEIMKNIFASVLPPASLTALEKAASIP